MRRQPPSRIPEMDPDEQIVVLNEGKRLGPFTPDELLDQIERGVVSYEDACLRAGANRIERVREVLEWEAPEAEASQLPSEKTPESEASEETARESQEKSPPSPALGVEDRFEDDGDGDDEPEVSWQPFEENDDAIDDEFDPEDDDFDLDEEIRETLEEIGEPRSAGPPSNPNTVLYAGHPSFLSFPRIVLVVLAALGIGIGFRETSPWILLAGLIIALFGVSWVFLQRSMALYLITPRRVEIVTGLFAKSSNEVRIDDIRTINVVKSGFIGLIGVGTVEFASAGGSTVEVAFQKVWAANRIKGLVRRLQDIQDD